VNIGWITGSYGRLVHFIFNLCGYPLLIENQGKLPKELQITLKKLQKSIWVFPEAHNFPFFYDFISSKVLVLKSKKWIKLYNLIVKLFPNITISTDDLKLFDKFMFSANWNFSEDLLKFAEKYAEPLANHCPGLENNNPIVLYGIRDGIWSNNNNDLNHSEQYRNDIALRNSLIENHMLAIESLCYQGFYVVRIGRTSLHAKFQHINFSDYATNPKSKDKTDLLLWSKAKLAISTGFGADEMSIIFNTPVLYVDFASGINFECRYQFDLLRAYLPKTFVWSQTLEKLTLRELESIGYFDQGRDFNIKTFGNLGVLPLDNKSELISLVVNDYISFINNGNQSQFIDLHGKNISIRWPNLIV
jgi:putative glycosyltransferase (TIGR04372 family)